MKICFLADASSIHSKRWIEYFAEKNHQVYWISLSPSRFERIKGVKFYRLLKSGFKPLDIIFNIIPLAVLLKKIKPDVLHAHYAGVNGVLGAFSRFHPLIITAWGSDILIAGKSKIAGPLISFALRKADIITCDAEHMKVAMGKMEVDPDKIKIIKFGVDTKKFKPRSADEEVKKKLGIESGELVVISIRSLEPIYDVPTLVRAIPSVLKELPNTKFLIGGSGSEENKIKDLVEKLGVRESVNFLGFINNQDLPFYFNAADVYVSTSLSDAGIASSTAEAMASGLPVVITNTGENEKWINEGENGFLVPAKDYSSLAGKIINLLKEEEIREEIGKEGRKTIEEKDDFYADMEKMERIIENYGS